MNNSIVKEKILIANRGEIACRIIKTAKKMGFSTVAVFSEVDVNSLYVQMADEAVYIGGKLASESYLDIKKIVNAAKKVGANYVHPGYGFLSENYRFAEALKEANIIFIAPPIEAIKKMGDKIESKKTAGKAGVSVVPGYDGVVKDSQEAEKIAKKIGLPVMIKASAGGGGKGMRMVSEMKNIKESFEIATNEAQNNFGDGRVFIEKFIQDPRHIEIQVIGDKFGNIVCLGERECSIQRNNQKVIEEAPSSFVDEKTRQKMYNQAIALCKEVGYYSAGTIECMMDKDKNFYFLEMNTRLQVEHGITELITGFDIVELMIRVARGEKLNFTQKDVKLTGWAMEARICSEDPTRGFLPSSGRLSKYVEPLNVDGVRVDSGVYEGFEISSYYDSMIAKLLTHAPTREEAINSMQTALSCYFINGVSHNIAFLEKIMCNERFKSGEINTNFIKQEFSSGFVNDLDVKDKNILIPIVLYMNTQYKKRIQYITGSFKKNKINLNRLVVDLDGKKFLCDIYDDGEYFKVEYGTGYSKLKTVWKHGENIFRGEVNNNPVNVRILNDNYSGNYVLQYMGTIFNLSVRSVRISELEQFMPKKELVQKPEYLKSPITGKLTRIKVKEGDEILAGAELCCIEAMKMENVIKTEFDTKIKKINKAPADLLNKGDIIIEFE